MKLLVFVLLLSFLSSQHAEACDVNRPLIRCDGIDCAEAANTAFDIYIESERRCGVREDSLPFILKSKSRIHSRGAVILLHGLTAGPAHMRVLAEHLVAIGYDVVVPILKGHGGADDMLIESSIREWKLDASFAWQVASKFNGSVHVVGHSTGGMLAALDASEHPGRYKTVTGLDPFLNSNGPMGYQMKYTCLARHLWNYQSEIFAGYAPFSDYWNKSCSVNSLRKDPELIAFQLDHQIQEILSRTCIGHNIVLPHFNYEWPLQSLCSLKLGVDQLSSEKVNLLPPTHLELTRDDLIFNFEDRKKLIDEVGRNPQNTINDLDTDEVEPKAYHAFMMLPCAQHYSRMETRIIDWIESHP